MLVAVMDLGSNSFKMTVAQWSPESNARHPFRILHKERHPIQLGASSFSGGRISDSDFKAGLQTLQKMQSRLRDFSSPILRVVATSAIRDAANGREFVKRAREELGIPVEVITGSQEARLISHGLTLEYPQVKRGLLVDIGGGSTEVASFGKGWNSETLYSFRLGSVRLATRFFSSQTKDQLSAARQYARSQLKGLVPSRIEKLVGSAGTIQSLGEILAPSSQRKEIRRQDLDAWIERVHREPPGFFIKNHDLAPSRARVVIPGAVILSEVLHWLKAESLTVTGMTLRDGLMVDLVERWQASEREILKATAERTRRPSTLWSPKRSDRSLLSFLEETAQRFHVDMAHSNHIAALSLSLFDQMKEQGFAFEEEERRILMVAAYLHDMGRIISEGGHHKHSAYILRNLKIPDLTPLETKKAALVALYHRKDPPPKKDPLPEGLKGVHAEQVRRLTALLRLADGLDEAHNQQVRSLRARQTKKQMLLELRWASSVKSPNLSYFRDKASYFEEYFGLKVVSFVGHERWSGVSRRTS